MDFTDARDGTEKGKPPEKAATPDTGKQQESPTPRRGSPPKEGKSAPGKTASRDKDELLPVYLTGSSSVTSYEYAAPGWTP